MLESTCRDGCKSVCVHLLLIPIGDTCRLAPVRHDPRGLRVEAGCKAEKLEAIKNASSLLSISENTARDACRFHPERCVEDIKIAYCATSDHFQPSTQEETKEFKHKYGIRKPYYLLVGSSTGYKNAQLFFEGFAQLPREAYDI